MALLALWLGTGAGIAQEGNLRRLVSGIPVTVPVAYAVLLLLGLLGTPLARTWWLRLWPPEAAADYAGRTGYWAACGVRFLAFTLIFLPLTALVAAPRSLGGQIWQVVRGPLRGLRGIAGWTTRRLKSPPAQAPAGDKPAQPDAAAEAPPVRVPPPPVTPVPLPPTFAPPPMAVPPPPKASRPAPAFFTPPPRSPPSSSPPARTPPVLPMPPSSRVPSAQPPFAPAMSAPAMSAPAMWAPPKAPPQQQPQQPPAGAGWSKPPQRDEPSKPARSWIANLPKDDDL